MNAAGPEVVGEIRHAIEPRTTRPSVYIVRMPRVNVYLPDDLATEVKEAGLNVSAVLQEALRRKLASVATDRWLEAVRSRPASTVTHEQALAALDAARDEAPTWHG